jgi:hypothetical protein
MPRLPDSATSRRARARSATILALRADDGHRELLVPDFAYPQGTAPGEYRFTPGATFAFAPGLGTETPFVLPDGAQFRPGPPYAVTDPRYTADFEEIKALGGDGVTTPSARTADQTEIALFWYESSPLQWNRIARTAAARTGLDQWQEAPARPAERELGGRLHQQLRDQVRVQVLAARHRDPARGDGRKHGHGGRSELDAPAPDARDPRL